MKQALTYLSFGLGASALVARDAPQCVQLQASGGASGVLGQLSDGQNRVGGGHPLGCYCLSNGGFKDSKGRGCILTPPTTQFQCDVGASPTTGFSIGSDGAVTHDGNGKFWACPVNDKGEYNVYSEPVKGQSKCTEISLSSAGACGSSKPAPSKPAQPAPSKPAQPAPSKPAQPKPKPNNACPADLNGAYQFPHLIVPVNSAQPDKAYGTSYFGKVDSTTCSIFNFDIPASYSGKKCTVAFLFPEQKDLQTSSFTTSGNGNVVFSKLKGPATQSTTYANQPAKESQIGSFPIAPGNSYVVASGDCAAGQRISYEMCAEGSYALNYFQDYNPSPIGLYVRQC